MLCYFSYVALDMISVESKKDYLEAVRLAPSLIKSESDPVKFLRAQDFNPWKAAKSLVLHWEYRKFLFQNRWLLPLNDSGAGALDSDDIQLLRSGWLTFVTPRDASKGRFMLVDHGKALTETPQSRLRVVFYLCTMATDKVAQSTGMTLIRLISKADSAFTGSRLNTGRTVFKMMKEAMPLQLRQVYLLKLTDNNGTRMLTVFLGRVRSTLFELLDADVPLTITVHRVDETAETLHKLGVPADALPENHGGTWSHDRMFEWEQVIKREEDMAKLKIPWLAEHSQPSEDRTRKVNALYARRAYEKRKLKLGEQEETAKRLRLENEMLRKDNEHLEALLERALDIIALFDNLDSM